MVGKQITKRATLYHSQPYYKGTVLKMNGTAASLLRMSKKNGQDDIFTHINSQDIDVRP